MFSVSKHGTIGTTKYSARSRFFTLKTWNYWHYFLKIWKSIFRIKNLELLALLFFKTSESNVVDFFFFCVFDVENLELLALVFWADIPRQCPSFIFYESELGTIGTTISNLTICQFFSYNKVIEIIKLGVPRAIRMLIKPFRVTLKNSMKP